MGGGTGKGKKSAIYQMCNFENRQIYYKISKTSTKNSGKLIKLL